MYTKTCEYCGCEFQGRYKTIGRFCNGMHRERWKEKNKTKFSSIRHRIRGRARTRKILFEISTQDIKDIYKKQGEICKYTGRKLSLGTNKDEQISLDRRDSSLPYTKDNVDLVCLEIQFAKHDMTSKKFIKMCHDVARNNPLPEGNYEND